MKWLAGIATILSLSSCDGSYRVKQDYEISAPLKEPCIEQVIHHVLPDGWISSKREFEGGQQYVFCWEAERPFYAEITQTSKNKVSMLELSSEGVTAASHKVKIRQDEDIAQKFNSLASELRRQCGLKVLKFEEERR